MLQVQELNCKTILNKSSLSDFTLNCYLGCAHSCLYCYGRYILKFKEIAEDWGCFVQVKINAPQVLSQQLKKLKAQKEVFMSSICDGWQPLEEKYRLSRECLKLLLEAGFSVSLLTKSSLIQRDFDLLAAYKTPCLGMSITTWDLGLQKTLEPYASTTLERLNILKKAGEKGIATWVFLGPLMPEFTDTNQNLEAIFQALSAIAVNRIYVDRLNLRWGVLESLKRGLKGYAPRKLELLVETCRNSHRYLQYSQSLKARACFLSAKFGLSNKLTFCF